MHPTYLTSPHLQPTGICVDKLLACHSQLNMLEVAERTSMFAFRSGGAWEQGCCFKERNWSKMRNMNIWKGGAVTASASQRGFPCVKHGTWRREDEQAGDVLCICYPFGNTLTLFTKMEYRYSTSKTKAVENICISSRKMSMVQQQLINYVGKALTWTYMHMLR